MRSTAPLPRARRSTQSSSDSLTVLLTDARRRPWLHNIISHLGVTSDVVIAQAQSATGKTTTLPGSCQPMAYTPTRDIQVCACCEVYLSRVLLLPFCFLRTQVWQPR